MKSKKTHFLKLISESEVGTMLLGEAIGRQVVIPFFIALRGELGSGKTTLVRGIAKGVGISKVRSPSFTIIQRYRGRFDLYHIDLYRVENAEELVPLGLNDIFYDFEALVVVEWAERGEEMLPKDRLDVDISIVGKSKREFRLKGRGVRGIELVKNLRKALLCAEGVKLVNIRGAF